MILLLAFLFTGLSGADSEHGSGSGSGDVPDEISGDDDSTVPTTVDITDHVGYLDETTTFFTPPPSYPPEAYQVSNSPVTERPPTPEDGFYIGSDGSGGDYSDDEDLPEVQFLEKAFELKTKFDTN
ncbi:protein E30 [Elephant endotheliotropic herpesvirus 2]|nr:protein E30 [Elephant endotheliotropic herpesvirus 2]